MKKILACLFIFLLSSFSIAEEDNSTRFENVTVHYSVFSSTSILPKVADQLGIVRGKNYVWVNIAVVDNDTTTGGKPATVTGVAKNLMQQIKKLDFKEISESTATYYIATLRVTEEEVFHFTIDVTPEGATQPDQIQFTKTLYVNE